MNVEMTEKEFKEYSYNKRKQNAKQENGKYRVHCKECGMPDDWDKYTENGLCHDCYYFSNV